MPVTTVPRTLFDLAAVLDRHRLERAANEAEARRLADPLSLDDLLLRYPRRPGSKAVRQLLNDDRIDGTISRSEFEEHFLAFVEERGLPRPEVNAGIWLRNRWIEVDCLWRSSRLIVELDSRAFHGTGRAFEQDRLRDRSLIACGWSVIRVTWRQLHHDAEALEADLRAMVGG